MRALLALGNHCRLGCRTPHALLPLRRGDRRITFLSMSQSSAQPSQPCPKCGSSSVRAQTVCEDKRASFLEIEVTCQECSFPWREFFQKGIMVKWVDMTPKPKPRPKPIQNRWQCPYCGKPCHPREGVPILFEDFRVRQFMHRACLNLHGGMGKMPFDPIARLLADTQPPSPRD